VSTSAELAVLVAAVRGAIDDAERELSRMPFFVRPMARKGFSSRTGLTYDEWREHLGALRAGDSPSTARARWTGLEAALQRLADDFRTAPERAAKGMRDPVVLNEVRERSVARVKAVDALLAWSRAGA